METLSGEQALKQRVRRWTLFWLASNRAEDEQNNVHSSRPFTSGISAERKELLTLAEKENRAKRRKPLSEAGYAQLETAMPEYSYLTGHLSHWHCGLDDLPHIFTPSNRRLLQSSSQRLCRQRAEPSCQCST